MKYSENHTPLVCIMTNSTCYLQNQQITPKGILLHSTGTNNPNLQRYVQPSKKDTNYIKLIQEIGINNQHTDWNHNTRYDGVNAWIGKLLDGSVATVQTLPWDKRPLGCGIGPEGSCNDGWIQIELCEDSLLNGDYFLKVYKELIELLAYLCKMFNINPYDYIEFQGKTTLISVPTILCHADASNLLLASKQQDVYNWFSLYNKDMNSVKKDVKKLLLTN